MGESIQLYDDMAEKGINNKDAFINKAKNFIEAFLELVTLKQNTIKKA